MNSNLYNSFKPLVKLVTYLNNSPNLIASAGKSTITPKNVENIINEMRRDDIDKWLIELIRRGHGSPLEHSLYIFEVTCSRVCSHQLIRHRVASYTQLSQRYSDKYLGKLIEKIGILLNKSIDKTNTEDVFEKYAKLINEFVDKEYDFEELLSVVSGAFIIPPRVVLLKDIVFLKNLLLSIYNYYCLLSRGLNYEDARYILPQCIKTRLLVTMNARELVEVFLPLRMCSRAQWEIRYIAWNMWIQLVNIHPEIFSYTGPRCIYYDLRVSNKTCSLKQYLEGGCEFTIERCPELVRREKIIECITYSSKDPWSGIHLYK